MKYITLRHGNLTLSRQSTMELGKELDIETDLQAQQILLASSHHDLETLRTLLRTGSANAQDPETGFTPLHAAIASCERCPTATKIDANPSGTTVNGHSHVVSNGGQKDAEDSDVEAAAKTMRLLLQNGAIWNDLDVINETPGCLACRLGLTSLYDIMVDAGVRAELLLNRLDEYEQLRDKDEDEEEVGEGARAENDGVPEPEVRTDRRKANETSDYLHSSLTFQPSRILDSDQNPVMMSWETPIMQRTADLLCPRPGLRILNIGHGMGIVDNFFQSKNPSTHHIIEAHPSVLEHMKASGWNEKPGVTIHEGTWQSILPKLMEQEILFDAIYFDTFAEDYKALRDFFSDFLIGILDEGGKWGFFNGLGADRQVCYDVYCKLVEMDLSEAGYDVTWEALEVKDRAKEDWEGVKRRYWVLEEYKLPICEFVS